MQRLLYLTVNYVKVDVIAGECRSITGAFDASS